MDTKKILIMEDEISSLEALKEVFEERGHEVLTAQNGEDGIALAIKKQPELILLDIIMPKKDGFEVIEELKRNEQTKAIPIIILTNLSQPQDVQKAIELGARTFLVKSEYQLDDIVKKVEENLK